MGKQQHRIAALLLSLAAAVFTPGSCAGAGFRPPPITQISSFQELTDWYCAPENGERWCILKSDIEISSPVTLGKTGSKREINTGGCTIRITSGGSVTVDNPELMIFGESQVFTVEKKGQLFLNSGRIGNQPNVPALLVKQGGYYEKKSGFTVDGKIWDQNSQSPDESLPDGGNSGKSSITGLIDEEFTIYCQEGEAPPASEYPGEALVYADPGGRQLSLPVQWDPSSVDFSKPGIYRIKGTFTEGTLAANDLKNPDGLAPYLNIEVRRTGPIDSLEGQVMSVDKDGLAILRLRFPVLPEDAVGIYLYTSTDGVNYKKVLKDIPEFSDDTAPEDNFLTDSNVVPPYQYLVYRYYSDDNPLWVKLEIRGSVCAGMSNAVECRVPSGTRPGTVAATAGGDDGSSGGNRGGGGQGVWERTGKSESGGPAAQPFSAGSGGGGSLPGPAAAEQLPDGKEASADGQAGEGESPSPDLSNQETGQALPSAASKDRGTVTASAASGAAPAIASGAAPEAEAAAAAETLPESSDPSPSDRSIRAVLITAVLVCGLSVGIRKFSKKRKS